MFARGETTRCNNKEKEKEKRVSFDIVWKDLEERKKNRDTILKDINIYLKG